MKLKYTTYPKYIHPDNSKLINNKETAINIINKSCNNIIDYISNELKDNEEVIKCMLNNCRKYIYVNNTKHSPVKYILPYASDRLKDDKKIIKCALDNYAGYHGHGSNQLQYASDRLRDNRDLILYANDTGKCANACLKYASDRLKDDAQFIKNINKNHSRFIGEHISERLKDDEDFTKYLISVYSSIEFASKRLRHDRNIVLFALEHNEILLYSASAELQNDEEIVMKTVSICGNALENASDRLKDDETIVLKAVKEYSFAFEYASDRLKNKRNVLMQALKSNDKEYHMIYERKSIFECLPTNLALIDDEDILLEYVDNWRNSQDVFTYTSDRLKDDDVFVRYVIDKCGGDMLKHVSDRLKNDMYLCLYAFDTHSSGNCMQFVSNEVKNNSEFMLELLWYKPWLISCITDELSNNDEFIEKIIEYENPYFNKKLHTSERIQKFGLYGYDYKGIRKEMWKENGIGCGLTEYHFHQNKTKL
jgi:hypothetical protein